MLLLSLITLAIAGQGVADGRAAHVVSGTATAHLHLVKVEGSQLVETGPISGALTGSASGVFHTGAVFSGTFTIDTHSGAIKGQGHAIPHGSGRYQSFSGSFLVTGGTGRYAHISGRAGLYGVIDRRHDTVVIQTTGTLNY